MWRGHVIAFGLSLRYAINLPSCWRKDAGENSRENLFTSSSRAAVSNGPSALLSFFSGTRALNQ